MYVSIIDKHLITRLSFLDMSKLFDCRDHEIVFRKYYHYDIGSFKHKIFCSYLRSIQQCTRAD